MGTTIHCKTHKRTNTSTLLFLSFSIFYPLNHGHCFINYFSTTFHLISTGFEVPKIPGCRTPLGMENGQISNGSITASSQQYTIVPGLDNARLHFSKGDRFGGAWMPQMLLKLKNITEYHSQWLQIDFQAETQVTGISTQGSHVFHHWVETYSLRYSTNGSYFVQYQPQSHNKVVYFGKLPLRGHRLLSRQNV